MPELKREFHEFRELGEIPKLKKMGRFLKRAWLNKPPKYCEEKKPWHKKEKIYLLNRHKLYWENALVDLIWSDHSVTGPNKILSS